MSIKDYLDKMKTIQISLLDFINNEENDDEAFKSLINKIEDLKNQDSQKIHQLKLFLHLLLKISNNHHRATNFFNKIERILNYFKSDITKHFSSTNLFNFFKSNKRLLLYFIKKGMITINQQIVSKMTKSKYIDLKYPQYFYPEIKSFIDIESLKNDLKNDIQYSIFKKKNINSWVLEISNEPIEIFEEKRKLGENDTYICQLIRLDKVEEFIQYYNKNSISLNSIINQSIFETNEYLNKKDKISLIEYAAFFGSIQIFQHLFINRVVLESCLWDCSIHSNDASMIHFLEENKDNLNSKMNEYSIFLESIKCHHIDVANYFAENYVDYSIGKNTKQLDNTFKKCLECYYFVDMHENYINTHYIYELCKYDYYFFVNELINKYTFDINKEIPLHFLMKYQFLYLMIKIH